MRPWLVRTLGAGALLAAGPLVLHGHREARAALLALAGIGALAAVAAGVARYRPPQRMLWFALALALAVFVVADSLRSLSLLGDAAGHHHAVHAVYGMAYPLLAVALVLALRRLIPGGGGRELALDGALVGVATVLITWPYLFAPRLHEADLVLVALDLAQPVGDVVVVAALGGALVSAGRLHVSERLLALGLAALFAGDVVYVASPAWGVPLVLAEGIWIYAYVLFAAAALHPSMRDLSAPDARRRRSAGGRLAVVATAGLVTPTFLVVEAWRGHVEASVVAVGAIAFAALVVARLALLLGEANRLRERAELSEARLRMLFDASPIGISLPPADDPLSGKLAHTNRALQQMLGYTGEELAALDWQDVTVPDGREENERIWEELLRGERQSYRTEGTYIRKDGTHVETAVHVSIARDEAGTPLLAMGLIEDISEHRRAERELAESEQRYRDLLGGIEAMVWECRVGDWGYTYVSGGVEQLLGFPVERWLQDANFWVDRLHPDDRDRIVALAREGELTGGGWAAEYRLLHADGHAVWVRDVVRVVHDEDGCPERLRGVLVDITQSKEAEAERELLRDQLRQKQKVEALGELAGGVAHDFNNLLTAMTGHVELAQVRAGGDPALARHLDEIRRSAGRAAALTRQLLAFGRRQILTPRVLDLNEVVLGAGELVRRLVGDAIELRLDLGRPAARVEADPNQLEQVIMNLAVNARDAMPEGGRLTVRTGRRTVEGGATDGLAPEPGEYATLVVEDTGVGMSDAVRRRAFDPFFTTKPPGQGTGLGLSTVFGIVSQSGGHVALDSAAGRGTAVTVFLPLTNAAAAGAAPPPPVAAAAGTGTVLLVEDEPAVRAIVETALTDAGYDVVTAADGVGALDLLARHAGRIDLILSDVSMPRMGGLELLRRCAVERPEARTLLMTGYADSVPTDVPLLRKPFSLDELRDAVRDAIGDRAPQAA